MPESPHSHTFNESVRLGAAIRWRRNAVGGLVSNAVPGQPAYGVSDQANRSGLWHSSFRDDTALLERWIWACEKTMKGEV